MSTEKRIQEPLCLNKGRGSCHILSFICEERSSKISTSRGKKRKATNAGTILSLHDK